MKILHGILFLTIFCCSYVIKVSGNDAASKTAESVHPSSSTAMSPHNQGVFSEITQALLDLACDPMKLVRAILFFCRVAMNNVLGLIGGSGNSATNNNVTFPLSPLLALLDWTNANSSTEQSVLSAMSRAANVDYMPKNASTNEDATSMLRSALSSVCAFSLRAVLPVVHKVLVQLLDTGVLPNQVAVVVRNLDALYKLMELLGYVPIAGESNK